MNLEQIKKLIIGILQGWFKNKTVLDKLTEKNGKLYYNNIEISMNSLTQDDVSNAIDNAINELKINTIITNSINNEFINHYNPTGVYNFDEDNKTIIVSYEDLTSPDVMNDMARFFGTLHENGIKNIIYKEEEYIWNPDLSLQGSNWAKTSDNQISLVSVIVSDFKNQAIIDNKIQIIFDKIQYIYTCISN